MHVRELRVAPLEFRAGAFELDSILVVHVALRFTVENHANVDASLRSRFERVEHAPIAHLVTEDAKRLCRAVDHFDVGRFAVVRELSLIHISEPTRLLSISY